MNEKPAAKDGDTVGVTGEERELGGNTSKEADETFPEFTDTDLLIESSLIIQGELHALESCRQQQQHDLKRPVPFIFLPERNKVSHFETRLELPPVLYPLKENPPCELCKKSIDYDLELYSQFQIFVCRPCRSKYTEEASDGDNPFKLLPKTQVKEMYLLTEDDLKYPEEVPFVERPNPKLPTWTPMHLYLRYQIEKLAIQKYGSLRGIEEERQNRAQIIVRRKEKQFKEKMLELRAKTRLDKSMKKPLNVTSISHHHEFVVIADSGTKRKCKICHREVIIEEF